MLVFNAGHLNPPWVIPEEVKMNPGSETETKRQEEAENLTISKKQKYCGTLELGNTVKSPPL
jgi:hypothetical protein